MALQRKRHCVPGGLKPSSKSRVAASSLGSRRNSMLRLKGRRLVRRVNWMGTSEPSSDPRYPNSEPRAVWLTPEQSFHAAVTRSSAFGRSS